jgi:hypothetical protein
MNNDSLLLIGDNPFHGISHLSQERARTRSGAGESAKEKADVVMAAVENGADGFMFSVNDLTLSILEAIRKQGDIEKVQLFAIVPYGFEYVRIAAQTGMPGLAKKFTKQLALSGSVGVAMNGLASLIRMSPKGLVKTYLGYELSRIKSSTKDESNLKSILLAEIVTDMGLALNFEWLFKEFVRYVSRKGLTPGFNSRNLPLLVKRLNEWQIDLDETLLVTPFNEAGFQMNPSKQECEATLAQLPNPVVLAISVLAAGYFKPSEAAEYVASLNNLRGVVAGASTGQQAREFFQLFKQRLA